MERDWEAEGIPPPPTSLGKRRNPNGRFMPDPNHPARCAWAAARWTVDGWTLQQISDAMSLGGKGNAHHLVQTGLRATREATAATTEQARTAHRTRLEYAIEVALDVLERDHVHVSQGRVMKDDDGIPLLDDGPKLAAATTLRALSESLRKLDGLDAPSRVSVDAQNLGQEVGDLLTALTQAATDDGTPGT